MSATTSSELDYGKTVRMPAGTDAAPGAAPQQSCLEHAIAFVEGSGPNLTGETNAILRDRLRIASAILFAGFLAFLIKGLIFPAEKLGSASRLLMWLHVGVTTVTGMVALRMWTNCKFFHRHLRMTEMLLFGSSGLFFAAVSYATIVGSAERGFLLPVMGAWLILMFTYALFIPNTWQRASLMITPMAIAPVAILFVAWITHESVRAVVRDNPLFQNAFLESFMVMVFGSVTAVWGVRTIRSLRTAAFEARQLGQYRLKRLLGEGGMGEVYLAEHMLLKRPCAIKLIHPDRAGDEDSLARFEREVQASAQLTHWNTIEIYDYGHSEDGTFYYVMEYLPGMNLDELVAMHGPIPPGRVVHLLSQTCEALAEAHAAGLVHRDIKPGNIFAAHRGGTFDVAKLLDFGLVRSSAPGGDVRLTQEGMVTGSPLYMSPEQASGDLADERSDIYALGCVAYYLLTGRPPFEEDRPIKLILAHAQQQPESLSSILPDIPDDLERIVLKCLEKDPHERYPNVDALRAALLDTADAGTWTREDAVAWWQCHGCPKKRHLDNCVREGRDVAELTI